MSKRIRLPRSRDRSRTSRGNRSNTSPTGVIRAASTSACIAETSRVIRSLSSAEVRVSRARARARPAGSWRRPARRPASSARPAGAGPPGSGGRARQSPRIDRIASTLHRRHLAGAPDDAARCRRRSPRSAKRKEKRPSNSSRSSAAAGGRRPEHRAERLRTAQDQRGPGAPHHRSRRMVTDRSTARTSDPTRAVARRRGSGALATRRPVELGRELGARRRRRCLRAAASTPAPSASTARNRSWNTAGSAATRPLPQRVEQVLQPVGQLGHAGVAHRRRHALDRVHRAEEPVHRLERDAGARSHSSSELVAELQVLAALGEKERGVLGQVHRISPGRAGPPRARGMAGTA